MAIATYSNTPVARRDRGMAAGRLGIASIVWLLAIVAAALTALVRGVPADTIAPFAIAAVIPPALSFLLSPVLHREWAQILVIMVWLALAIVACLVGGFTPMALLFLCAPAAAALFEREKVVEALVLAAILAALLYYAAQKGAVPESSLSADGLAWGTRAGIVATLMFLVTAMFGAASRRQTPDAFVQDLDVTSRADLLGAVPGPVLAVNANDQVDFASRDAMDVFGISSDFGVMPVTALLSADFDAATALRKLMARARATQHRQTEDIRFRDRAGLEHALRVTVSNIEGPGNSGRLLVQAMDLTDRAEQMDRMRRERVDTNGDSADRNLFFAGVSHELRTPLNAIIGFSDMMRSRMFGPLPGRYAEYADLIHDSGQHMLDLIGDVLDLSKVEAGRYDLDYDIFDAGDVVRSSVKMVQPLADNAETLLVLDVPEDDVLVEADRRAVRQILLNLLSNAVKFSPPGGQIDVALQAFEDNLVFSVEDQGAGMSSDEIGRIGQPFEQGQSARSTSARGSGLGLALVRSLTELHEGEFSIESDIEDGASGTLATVTLPRRRDL